MRKLFILAIALSINIVAFAQRVIHTRATDINSINNSGFIFGQNNSNARITAVGDTLVLSNIPAADTPLVIYSAGISDSGYLTGTDIYGDQGFAERYDINGSDSSVIVIGVVALFNGTVSPSSAKTITFNAWNVGAPLVVSATFEYSGFPGTGIDSLVVPITQLGIGTATDTIKTFLFPNFTPDTVQSSFFVGYTINYNFATLNGDTLGLACSTNGTRTSAVYDTTTYTDSVVNSTGTADSAIYVLDTVVNVQNTTQWSDYSWHDNYTDNDSLFNVLAIYPIVYINSATGIKGVTRKDLTFFGNYPNPAVNSTNIKFSLLHNASVTIQIMDMKGGVIGTINNTNLSIGEHIIPVNTSGMPSGDYLYFIHTSGGDGIASKMTVLR